MADRLKAGFGKGTIHFPKDLFPLENFCGVHDDPHVRLMVLQFPDESFALLEGELVIIPKSSVDRWRSRISEAFQIPVCKVVIQMTHTISTPHEPGPMGPPARRPDPTEEELHKRSIYHQVTDAAVEEAICQARENFGDAVPGWGSGLCEVNVNCDQETPFGWWLGADLHAVSNHKMTILRVNDTEGNTKGMFVSFGMKPAAIDNAGKADGKRLISADITGVFCEKMEETYGVPVIYSVSAGGNQIPKKSALKSVVTAQGEIREIDEGPAAGLAYAAELGNEMYLAGRQIADGIICNETINQTEWKEVSFQWIRKSGGPRKLLKSPEYIPEKETKLSAETFRMGQTVFVFVRPEMTAEAEQKLIEKNTAERIILMTLTNGEMKCLPDEVAFARGTYEAQGSNLMPGAAEELINRVLDVLK